MTRESFVEMLNLIVEEKNPGGTTDYRKLELRLSPVMMVEVYRMFAIELMCTTQLLSDHLPQLVPGAYKVVGLFVSGLGWLEFKEGEVGEFSVKMLEPLFCDEVKAKLP